MPEEGLADNAIRSYLPAIAGFTRWLVIEGHLLVIEGHLEGDPMTHVRRPSAPRFGARSWLPHPELAAFVAAVQDDPDPSARAALIIPVLCGTQRADTVALNVADTGSRLVPDAEGATECLGTLTRRAPQRMVERPTR